MKNFYKFRWAQKKNELFIEQKLSYNDQLLKKGQIIPNAPVQVKVSEGKIFYDIVRFQDPFNFAISQKVYDLLKKNEISGWAAYEISIENKTEKYFGFQVLGRCGKLKRPSTPGFIKGYDFDYKSWDGSDFFCPNETMLIFCTQRIKDIFDSNKISIINLVNIIDVDWYST